MPEVYTAAEKDLLIEMLELQRQIVSAASKGLYEDKLIDKINRYINEFKVKISTFRAAVTRPATVELLNRFTSAPRIRTVPEIHKQNALLGRIIDGYEADIELSPEKLIRVKHLLGTAIERRNEATDTLGFERIPITSEQRDSLARRCANCGVAASPTVKLSLCSRCRSVEYCCRDCQKQHWKTHKAACNQIVADAAAGAAGPPPAAEAVSPDAENIDGGRRRYKTKKRKSRRRSLRRG